MTPPIPTHPHPSPGGDGTGPRYDPSPPIPTPLLGDGGTGHGDGSSNWGQWRLDPDLLVLTHPRRYEVDLERCEAAAAVLDWIMQVNGKRRDLDVAGLVRAFHDVLHPQSTLCPFGGSRKLAPDRLRTLVAEAARRFPDRCV